MSTKKSTTKSNNKTKKQVKPKEEKIEEVKEVKEEVKEEKPLLNTKEIKNLIGDDYEAKKVIPYHHPFVNIVVIITMIISLLSFGNILFCEESSVLMILTNLLFTVFIILFGVISITYKRKSKNMILFSCLLLIVYFLLQFNGQFNVVSSPISLAPNFSGKSITEVMKWADKNKVKIEQEYEYSDMIPEYSVISQSIDAGTSLKNIDTIVVSISEGPNPAKEIMVPNMITWNSDKVLRFIEDNYMSNVEVEFVQSDKLKDTVIEQSASGSLKRDDSLKLTFSYGEELGFEEVSIIDFKNMSEFEVIFYMKKNQLNYSFDHEFDSKTKKGYAFKQNVPVGDKVKVNDKIVVVTISKGPEIKIPDFTKYSMTEVAEWAIKNKVKISFENEYDENVKENNIIRSEYREGDIIEQGTIVKIIISRGSLKMPKIKNLGEFYDWAAKYNISYEEVHEFHDSVPAGEVISYSYKTGEAIKKDNPIIVKISDGVKKTVPNVIGMTRKDAINKIQSAGFNYSVSYRNSTEAKDKVLGQSIQAGSEVSQGTTITITVSNGKKESSGGNNNNSGGSSTPTPTPTPTPNPTPTPDPEPVCENVTVYVYDELYDTQNPTNTCRNIKNRYPSLNFSCSYVEDQGLQNGILKNAGNVDDQIKSTCENISLVIVKNN